MKKIAERHLADQELASKITSASILTLLYGLGSGVLYIMLYEYQGQIREFAQLTPQGHHEYFAIPIAIAFVFSLVHGAFTGHFWESMGLRAKTG